MKKGDLVYVEWIDSAGSSGWHYPCDNSEWYDDTLAIIEDAGFFIKKTKHYIILCGKNVPKSKLGLPPHGDINKIPLGCIVKKKVVMKRR